MSKYIKKNDAPTHDTPEMIAQCLRCDKPECNNCLTMNGWVRWHINQDKKRKENASREGIHDHVYC